LEKCLKSLKGFDEIVVCDTGSTDKTVEIAKKYTDKVYTDYKWEDSFCKARNHALNKNTADWIYTIDADEYLESPVEKIREWINKAEKNKWLAVNVEVSSGPNDMFYSPRLHKRCPKVYWCADIHNYISVVGEVNSDIKHKFGYSPSHQEDPDRAFRILSKVVKENPKLVREKYYLAREYWYRKDLLLALFWYDEYISVAHYPPELADAWLMKARCLWNLRRAKEAKDACLQAILLNANFKEAILFLAQMSGPGNQKRWNAFAETATNEGLLFRRVNANK
jgi:glycosyltransferase involved in cell wall biosynthesis